MTGKISIILLILLYVFILSADSRQERLYNQARARINEKDFVMAFERIVNEYPDSKYASLSNFELGKYYLIRRDYEKAEEHLNQCHSRYVKERDYWIAQNLFNWGKYRESIVVFEDYIINSNNHDNIESSYIFVAEAYIRLLEFYRALNTLDELEKGRYLRQQKPLAFYKSGSTYEQVGDYEAAMKYYGKMKFEFPYHPLTYDASDRAMEIEDEGLLLIEPDLESEPEPEPEPIPEPVIGLTGMFLQVGAFIKDYNLTRRVATLEEMGYEVNIEARDTRMGRLYVVLVGPFEGETRLRNTQNELKKYKFNSFKVVK